MELDVGRYKGQIEKLTQELKTEKTKNRSSSVTVLEKISHIKNVLTSQIEEVRIISFRGLVLYGKHTFSMWSCTRPQK